MLVTLWICGITVEVVWTHGGHMVVVHVSVSVCASQEALANIFC